MLRKVSRSFWGVLSRCYNLVNERVFIDGQIRIILLSFARISCGILGKSFYVCDRYVSPYKHLNILARTGGRNSYIRIFRLRFQFSDRSLSRLSI